MEIKEKTENAFGLYNKVIINQFLCDRSKKRKTATTSTHANFNSVFRHSYSQKRQAARRT